MKFSEKNLSFLILAGGKGSRMGYRDKSLLKYNDKQSFLDKILGELPEGYEILLSKNSPFQTEDSRIRVIQDQFKECGPLGGIHSGFLHTSSQYLFILTCDTPNITREFVEYIMDQDTSDYDGVILRDRESRLHPLCGIYRRTLLENIEKNLTEGDFKILKIFQNKNLKVLDFSEGNFPLEKILHNVNTPSELEKISGVSEKTGEEV